MAYIEVIRVRVAEEENARISREGEFVRKERN